MNRHLRHQHRRLGAVVLGSIAIAACGNGGSDEQPAAVSVAEGGVATTSEAATTLEVVGAVTTSSTVEPPPPTTTEPAPTTPAASNPADETSSASAPSTSVAPSAAAVEMPELTALAAGTRYVVPGKVSTLVPSISVEFTAPTDGIIGDALDGFVGLSADEAGMEPMLAVIALDRALAVKDPIIDFENFVITEASRNLVEDAPADYLAWFAARPGVTAGPVTEAEIGGFPARQMTYQIGEVPGAFPCRPGGPGCLAWLHFPVGLSFLYEVGDVGTLYELDVDGTHLNVDVSDRAGAAELAETLAFVVDES